LPGRSRPRPRGARTSPPPLRGFCSGRIAKPAQLPVAVHVAVDARLRVRMPARCGGSTDDPTWHTRPRSRRKITTSPDAQAGVGTRPAPPSRQAGPRRSRAPRPVGPERYPIRSPRATPVRVPARSCLPAAHSPPHLLAGAARVRILVAVPARPSPPLAIFIAPDGPVNRKKMYFFLITN
jgi:hypothetical protein